MKTYALLVPCYNAASYIISFLDTIDKQSKKYDEILFYDDFSSDETVSILESASYKVIKGNINSGPSHARNMLIQACNCDFIHFHDPDDFMHNDYLLKVSSKAESGDLDVILCNVDWLNYKDYSIIISWKYSNYELNQDKIKYTLTHPIGGINGLYSKSILTEVKGFDENLMAWEDSDLHIRLAVANARFLIIEETLCYSIRRKESLSSNQGLAWTYRLRALRSYKKFTFTPEQRTLLGKEAEKVAVQLVPYNHEIEEARNALLFSSECGNTVPSSRKAIWIFLKIIFPLRLIIRIRLLQLRFLLK